MIGLSAFAVGSCSTEPNPDWANCPILERSSVTGNADVKNAQTCMDRTAAKLSKGPDSPNSIALASAQICETLVAKVSSDIDDAALHDKMNDYTVRTLSTRTAAVVVQVRAWKCLNNPGFVQAINLTD